MGRAGGDRRSHVWLVVRSSIAALMYLTSSVIPQMAMTVDP